MDLRPPPAHRTGAVSAARLLPRLKKMLPGKIGPYVRTGPVSHNWGYDRGKPIDRWYIEHFLEQNRGEIRGRVLEVKNDEYVTRFGRGVSHVDILDLHDTNDRATIIADLESADVVPADSYDCIVLTQVAQYCLDVKAAMAHCARILKPGGVLLLTVPGINKVEDHYELYRFTQAGLGRAAESAFGEGNVEIGAYGNSRVTTAFLSGLAREEFDEEELMVVDCRFPVVVTCRAVRAAAPVAA